MRDPRPCKCNSGLWDYPLYDARGIFCDYVCDKCKPQIKKKYRVDIFENPQYYCDEPVEEEW